MKTTVRRQLTLIVCVLFLSLLLIGISLRTLMNRSLYTERQQSLQKTADSVGVLLDAYTGSYFNTWDLRTNLSVAAASSGNDILICSPDGVVQLCAADIRGCNHLGRSIGRSTANRIFEGRSSGADAVSGIYGEERISFAMPVIRTDGMRVGIVLVSVASEGAMALSSRMLQIFVVAALTTLVVTLILTPFLARRETKPIQEMAAAARSIAHGNLTVRVPTGHSNEEMEELAIAFNNMAISLQHVETVRQEFVANVSHELKTPMTTIAGYLDGMIDGTIPAEKHTYYMELVSSEVRRLSRLVRNMLDVSRLRDQGIPADKMGCFDICEAAGQALLSFEQRINRKGLNVEVDFPELGLSVYGANDLITQVLYNLLDNAVKFIDEEGTLSIRVLRQGPRAVISIGNTGPTIPSAELPLLFDRFHKTDKSRSGDRDGVGLGLYIVKTIILAHGEDVYVTSRDGKTEFTFTLRAI